MIIDGPVGDAEGRSHVFATTHWSVVLAVGQPESPLAAEALEKLCRAYWYPLYVFVRSSGHSPADAEDLTQEFFARLIAKHYLSAVHRERGKFRYFLLSAVKTVPPERPRAGWRNQARWEGRSRAVRWRKGRGAVSPGCG